MIIVVDELKTTLQLEATAHRKIQLSAIRPYLYKHLSPSGTFTLTVTQNGNTLGAKSFTSLEMETNADEITALNYYHGFYTIQFDDIIQLVKGTFEITLSSSGYTFSESAYLGWVRQFDDPVDDFTRPDAFYKYPLTVEIWEKNKL